MKYKGNQFTATIIENRIIVDGYGEHSSLSAASRAITNTLRNGWTDLEILLPERNEWLLADKWRGKNN
jgi:hypothetical protein